MNWKNYITIVLSVILLASLAGGMVIAADDGPLFTRNISGTPETETGGAQISIMPLYVPAQNPQGEFVEIEYLAGDCTNTDPSGCETVNTMTEAKPLIASFEDGIEYEELNSSLGIDATNTGTGFGERDAYAALSLDDGATWKKYNLSDSARRSSFILANGHEYPGDVFRINHVVVGNRIAVAWISRYCESGSPLYSWPDEEKEGLLASYPEIDNPVTVIGESEPYQLYTDDLFGVAGSQGSVDYTLQGFPEVGEIPYGCVWVARGTLEEDPENQDVFDIVWRQAERLTSGRRDANRVDITGTNGAGFIVSWQEDPEGLRPGKGLGPGEGWSGAIANSKTDIWYSYIAWDDFDDVCTDDPDSGYCTPGELSEFALEGKPKVAMPFAVPARLTDNNACKAGVAVDNSGYLPYCYADFNDNGTADLCAESISWTNPGGTTLNVCIAEDGRVLTGRTASTRVRWALKPYTNTEGETSAWVVMATEKMKAMGTELDENEEPIDIGKDMWYHTFDMFNPELVQQGLILNAPALNPDTGEPFEVYTDEWGNPYHETEIARRFNLMVQSIDAAMASASKTAAILIYKQGIINQGGPADIFIRRVVLPDDFDPAVDNPFDYANVVCDAFDDDDVGDWLYTDGSNPNYVRGLCTVQGTNVSATTIISCDNTSGDTCAEAFPWDPADSDSSYAKVTEWAQTEDNLDDPSWENPYDVSKGHRGFIDGDFVMLMYAMAPNWKANTTGNEAYNLYVRRSFDGGQTWTTLPASFTHINSVTYSGDGTTTCEWYGPNGSEEEVCTDYGPGEFEQARNVSQLTGTRMTVLDPRYTPTGGPLKTSYQSLLCYDETLGDWTNCGYDETTVPYPEEIRDPSGYFVTYEVGDNTVVDIDTAAVPMDMYYSRAFNFGDDYDVIEFTTSSGQLVERWDWLENGPEISSEASVQANPDGSKFYAVWNQELEIDHEVYTNMDVEFRRIFYNLDTDAYPFATILYASHKAADYDDTLTFVASARDADRLGEGIVAYQWRSDRDGVLGTDKTLTIPASALSPGLHTLLFSAQDNEGNWTPEVSLTVFIAEELSQVHLPALLR